jgi:hypothetical protein
LKDNIKIEVREIKTEALDYIQLALGGVQRRTTVNTTLIISIWGGEVVMYNAFKIYDRSVGVTDGRIGNDSEGSGRGLIEIGCSNFLGGTGENRENSHCSS